MNESGYVELYEDAFRSAQAAVLIAAGASILAPLAVATLEPVLTTVPAFLYALVLGAWCSLAGVLFLVLLGNTQGRERRIAPALIYSIGLWLGGSFFALLQSGVVLAIERRMAVE